MRPLQPVRGTQDLLPEVARRHRQVTETARAVAELYGFAEIATPIFEFTEVFSRPIGQTSDIVSKEMYSFVDRGGEEVTLRPENTAAVVRAVLSDGLIHNAPLKFFYNGPMFRYERPQKGRYRQFHQIGVELIGVAQPQGDIEVIALGGRILDALGIRQRTVLELNTLGDLQSRAAYREVLVSYFSSRLSELSEDSRRRLERNPLRIFDSKEESDGRVSLTKRSPNSLTRLPSRTIAERAQRPARFRLWRPVLRAPTDHRFPQAQRPPPGHPLPRQDGTSCGPRRCFRSR